MASTKERWKKLLMNSQEFSIKKSDSIIMFNQVLVKEVQLQFYQTATP